MKKLHCVIHIGMPKTGSSAIQESLGLGKVVLKEHEYLKLENINHSPVLFTLFMDINQVSQYHWHKNAGRTIEEIEKLQLEFSGMLDKALEKSSKEKIIISGEDLYHLDLNATQRMKNALDRYCASYQIIGYIRSPVSFIKSAFQQNVKSGLESDFNTAVCLAYPYYKKLEKFDKVFGRENVKYIKFDPSTLYLHDIVHDFGYQIGEFFADVPINCVNEALSLEALSVLYIQRRYGSGFGVYLTSLDVNQKLFNVLKTLDSSTKWHFAPSLLMPILEKYRDDIRWMEERLGEPLMDLTKGDGYTIASENDLIQFGLNQHDKVVDLIARIYKESPPSPQSVARLVDSLMYRLKTH